MKKLYVLLTVVSFVITSGLGQNWNPFPEDSVYFINEDNPKDILIPVVKSQQPNKLLVNMFAKTERGFIAHSVTDLALTVTQNASENEAHWFGDQLQYNAGILSFQSVFSNQVLTIDVMASVGHINYQSFYIDNQMFYLWTEIEDQTFNATLNDSIKSIKLTLTDSLFAPKAFTFNTSESSDICTDIEMYNLGYSSENKRLLIGKNTGIQEIPNLAFYPFCRLFTKYKTIAEVKEELLDHHLNVGDIVEGSDKDIFVGSPIVSYYHYKKSITSVQLDLINDEYIYLAEYTQIADPNTVDEVVTVDPQREFKVRLWSDDIFTGVTNALGFGKMLRMESKWNYPYIQITNEEPYPSGGIVFGQVGLVQYIGFGDATLPVLDSEINGNQSIVDCITYYNINNNQFGVENMFSNTELEQDSELGAVLTGSEIVFNKQITGKIDIYQSNGQFIKTYNTTDLVNRLPIHKLDLGIYFVHIKHLNKTLKLLRQ